MIRRSAAALVAVFTSVSVSSPSDAKPGADWPSFRGTHASGTASGTSVPSVWDVEKGQGVAWKTPIPGLAHSSPVVWGDRVFITTSISGKANAELKVGLYGNIDPVVDPTVHAYQVVCVSKASGKILWTETAYKGVPKVMRHTKATHANSTMATDGKVAVAFFGSEGLYCYSVGGKLLWKRDLGTLDSGYYVVPTAQWGFASSPIIADGKVIVQCDIQKGSFLAALDLKSGKDVWRTPREEVPTWSTPNVYTVNGRKLVVVNGYKHIGGYDLATGKSVWRLVGGGDIPVPTPIIAHGLVFITNAHGRSAPIYAVKLGASGEIKLASETETHPDVAWAKFREGGYMQTPLIVGDYLYVCRDNGVLSCYEAKTGKRIYNERLGTGRTGFTASGVSAGGKLYFTSEEGDIHVVEAGPTFKLLGVNPMDEVCMATPAISEGKIIFRTKGHLVCIGPSKTASR